MLKRKAVKIIKEFNKSLGLNTRGYKTVELYIHPYKNGCTLLFHIGQWREEKEDNVFDYDAYIVNEDNVIIYDESNGEMPMTQIIKKYNEFKDKY